MLLLHPGCFPAIASIYEYLQTLVLMMWPRSTGTVLPNSDFLILIFGSETPMAAGRCPAILRMNCIRSWIMMLTLGLGALSLAL